MYGNVWHEPRRHGNKHVNSSHRRHTKSYQSLNAGLVKLCTECKGLTAKTILTQLQDGAWETAEKMNLDELESDHNHLMQSCLLWTRCTVTMRTLICPRVVNSLSSSFQG